MKFEELAFSGGGALGAFQWGVFRELEEVPKIISGNSAGAINSFLACHEDPEFGDYVYESLVPGILKARHLIAGIGRAISLKQSLLSNKPLRDLMNKHIRLEDLESDFFFEVTNMTTGEILSMSSADFTDNKEFRNALLASVSFCPILEPVSFSYNGYYIHQGIDGGHRNSIPIRRTHGDRLIILARPRTLEPKQSKNWIHGYFRSEAFEQRERVANDLSRESRVGDELIVEPNYEFSTIDFSKKTIQANIEEGRRIGKSVFELL